MAEYDSLLSFRGHPNLYNFHFMNFLCPDKEWIQIKPLSCMHLQTGFFHLPHGDFFIEPVKKHPLAEGEYHPHVVYKRQRRSVPEMKGPACGLKGIVLNLLTGCGSLFCSIFYFMKPVIIQICFLFPTLWPENMYHYTFHFSVLKSVFLTEKGKGISYYLATLVDAIYMVLVMLKIFFKSLFNSLEEV